MAVAFSLPSIPSPPCRRRLRQRFPCAALVQAPPAPASKSDAGGDGTGRGGHYVVLPAASLSVVPRDRAEDMQAEARAMERAANATVYSPELLTAEYSSRPFKVSPCLRRFLSFFPRLLEICNASLV